MLNYDFDIFDSDEFQNIVLEKEEIDDIEIEESYQYTIQFIVYDNDNTKIDIDLNLAPKVLFDFNEKT